MRTSCHCFQYYAATFYSTPYFYTNYASVDMLSMNIFSSMFINGQHHRGSIDVHLWTPCTLSMVQEMQLTD